MLFDEGVQDRDEIIISRHIMTAVIGILCLDPAVFIQHQLRGNSVAVGHTRIVQVVLGQDDGLLAVRQFELQLFHGSRSALIRGIGRDRMDIDQDIVVVIQALQDRVEFLAGNHGSGIAGGFPVSVECHGGIIDQSREAQVGDITVHPVHEVCVSLLVTLPGFIDPLISGSNALDRIEHRDRFLKIIACSECLSPVQNAHQSLFFRLRLFQHLSPDRHLRSLDRLIVLIHADRADRFCDLIIHLTARTAAQQHCS